MTLGGECRRSATRRSRRDVEQFCRGAAEHRDLSLSLSESQAKM